MENDYFKKQVIYIVYRSVTLHAVDMVYPNLGTFDFHGSIFSGYYCLTEICIELSTKCQLCSNTVYLISTVFAIDVASIIELTEEVTVVVQKAR